MKRNLSKTLVMLVVITNLGGITSTSVLAATNNKSESIVISENKEKNLLPETVRGVQTATSGETNNEQEDNKATNAYKNGIYELNNTIEDTSETGKSMVRRVLKDKTNMEVKDGKNYLTLELNPQGMLDNYRILVDNSEVNYEKETLDNGLLKLKFEVPSLDSKVSMKLYVIPMSRDVQFTVAHDKENVKLVRDSKLNEGNKPSTDNSNTIEPNITNESTAKPSEEKSSNSETNNEQKDNKETNAYKNEIYELNNTIEDTSETGKSMVRRVLKDKTNMEVKDGKNYLTLELNPQGMLDNYRILVDNSEVNYEKETLDNGLLKLKFEVPSLDSKVSMKLYVIPMSRDVQFTVAHDKENVKLIRDSKLNEDNKPSTDNSNTIEPNITNESATKASEDKSSNSETSVLKADDKANEKAQEVVIKGKLYTVQNEVFHDRQIGREMARKYLEKISKIEEVDGKTYATITFNNSQFMKEFKIGVNGENANYEIVERNGDLLSLRFEIPNIDADVKVEMFVIPMNSNVQFGVKFLQGTLNFVKEYEVKKNGTLPYTGGMVSGGMMATAGSLMLTLGAFMNRRKRR
ncbi:hypothetical protein JCM1393_29090 [Clostridium carnis]